MAKQNRGLDARIIGDDLCKLAEILNNNGVCIDVGPLDAAGQFCSKNSTEDEWSYQFNYLEFNIDKQSGTIPNDCEELKLRFSIHIIGILQEDPKYISNPLRKLNFDIEIMGVGLDYIRNECFDIDACWHLDKHIRQENDGSPKYSHPEYHLAFGGEKLKYSKDMYGSSLIMPSPRIAYPPMDAALGINFILQNYFHKERLMPILQDPTYKSIISNSQNLLFAPYAISLASRWIKNDYKFGDYFSFEDIFPLAN